MSRCCDDDPCQGHAMRQTPDGRWVPDEPLPFECGRFGRLIDRVILFRRRITARVRRVGPRAWCPGYEPPGVNPCMCPCFGCRNHCAACWYQPDNLRSTR